MPGPVDHDLTIVGLAGPRHGVCTRHDLLAAGVGPDVIRHRLDRGLLEPATRGVYVVPDLADDRTSCHVAVMAIPSAVISHGTAAATHTLAVNQRVGDRTADVSVPATIRRRIDGVACHRRRVMPSGVDVMTLDGLPITSVARTILDLSAVLRPARLRHVIQTAIRDRQVTEGQISACLAGNARRGLTGCASLRRLVADMFDGDPVQAGELEIKVGDVLAGVGGFVAQYRPPWFDGVRGVVDFANADLKVIVEADGRRWHQRDRASTPIADGTGPQPLTVG